MKVLITTGDSDGIGQEVTFKSINEMAPHSKKQFIIYCSNSSKIPKSIGKFRTDKCKSLSEALSKTPEKSKILIIQSENSPKKWVEESAQFLVKYPTQGCLINAPMSKLRNGSGHTEILKKMTQASHVQMCFYGKKFNVVLGTTHIPIEQITSELSREKALKSLKAARILHNLTNAPGALRILGLNPHSGENGAISKFDSKILNWLQAEELEVPDTAFTNSFLGDTFLCWYHDQGLIPFKMAHGFSHGIQVTLGLPFIRTSVDHGTAKNIYGKNQANHKSMKLAIDMAIKWAKKYKGDKL